MNQLHQNILSLCRARLGREPNLTSPTGYNDKIQWLKLFDQMPEHIVCCDKVAVRDFILNRVGPGHLVEVYEIVEAFSYLNPIALPKEFVVKTNHDSGSWAAVHNMVDFLKARRKIEASMQVRYGVEKGEWAYQFIHPKVIVERLLPDPIVDYKFHCCDGRVRWVQIIWDRASGHPKEAITDAQGNWLGLHMDQKMLHMNGYLRPSNLERAAEIASWLSKGFRYVRVDTYCSEGNVFVGEMTFWPKAGCYTTLDEPVFGHLLDFDMGFKRHPILEGELSGPLL
jgi:hypothetical protein